MDLASYVRECARRHSLYEDNVKEAVIIQEFMAYGYDTADSFIDLLRNSDDQKNKEIIKGIIENIDDRLLSLNIRNVPSYNYETLVIDNDKEKEIRYQWKRLIGG